MTNRKKMSIAIEKLKRYKKGIGGQNEEEKESIDEILLFFRQSLHKKRDFSMYEKMIRLAYDKPLF